MVDDIYQRNNKKWIIGEIVWWLIGFGVLAALIVLPQPMPKSGGSTKLYVQFNTVLDATRYEIQWATNSFFVPYYVTFTSTNFLPVTDIIYGQTYYVRMRCSQPSHSEWSTTSYYVATNSPIMPTVVNLFLESTTNRLVWKDEGKVMSITNPPGIFVEYRVRIEK